MYLWEKVGGMKVAGTVNSKQTGYRDKKVVFNISRGMVCCHDMKIIVRKSATVCRGCRTMFLGGLDYAML